MNIIMKKSDIGIEEFLEIGIRIDGYSESLSEESISVSSNHSSVSADSEEIQIVMQKTSKITEMVEKKLKAFISISQKCYDEGLYYLEENEELELLKESINETANECKKIEDNENQIIAKTVLDQILSLYKELNHLQLKLVSSRAEIWETEEEERTLKCEIGLIEQNVKKFMFEVREAENQSCHCTVF